MRSLSKMKAGFLDQVGLRSLRGWAMDHDGRPLPLIAAIDGQEAVRFTPDLPRPDLAAISPHPIAYEIDLPREVTAGAVVTVTDSSGRHVENSPYKVREIKRTRNEKATVAISRDMKILEIGPLTSPVVPRSKGWHSFSLDHGTREELQKKYKDLAGIGAIEAVDFVWRDGPIHGAVPAEHHGSFDAVIASHVIEHFPDPLGFLLSAHKLLKDGGVVSLIVPDKRASFDFFKPLSVTSDFLAAHFENRTRHSRKTAFDNAACNATSRGQIAWQLSPYQDLGLVRDLTSLPPVRTFFDDAVPDDAYVDYHNSVFTPSSFALIVLELNHLGVLPMSIIADFPTEGCEFCVTLQASGQATDARKLDAAALAAERLRLMKAVVLELGEQARLLATAQPHNPSLSAGTGRR